MKRIHQTSTIANKMAGLLLLSLLTAPTLVFAQHFPNNSTRYSSPAPRVNSSEPRENRPTTQRRPAQEEEDRQYSNVQSQSRPIRPAMSHAMTYNTRPGGIHINPDYFATHYGRAHGFHFTNYAGGPCIGDCGFRVFGGEWYFDFNGGWFGIVGQLPGNWAFQADYLYIDIGDDGNYYLYDAQFPDMAVQLTFVQNIGDDQAGADQDQGEQQ
jgi:hypothetical protein